MAPPSHPTWWHTGVIYQIYPRSWADADGDGVGDLQGIISRLDYLSETLGVDSLWLSPFYRSPQADFGYDVADHCEVDPMFGTMEDFDRLVAEAHRRGLRVIVDFVPNHTSDRHPWFLESRTGRDSPRRDWYVWRDPAPDGGPPNNWVSHFGGSAWTFDEASGQYYLHLFLAEQPDLNWRNPEVERAMHDVLRFWMDRGVDGFRIDVAHAIAKDPLLRDNPPAPVPDDGYKISAEFSSQRHVHDMADPDIHPMFRKIRRVVDGHPDGRDRYTVGEIHEFDWERWASYYGEALDELHQPYNFALLLTGLDPAKIRWAIEGVETAMPPGAWPNWVLGNHDEPRIVTRFGWEASKAAAVLLLTLRGTPTIYQGDEIGMEDLDIPPERQQDPWGRRMPGFGRDGCRTPMQWSEGEHAGFSPPDTPSTWLPVHPDHPRRNVASELADPDSHLSLYRRLLALRRSRPVLQLGDIELAGEEANPLAYRRILAGEDDLWVVLNLSDDAVAVPAAVAGRVLVGTDRGREGGPVPDTLGPWEALVVG